MKTLSQDSLVVAAWDVRSKATERVITEMIFEKKLQDGVVREETIEDLNKRIADLEQLLSECEQVFLRITAPASFK